MPKVQDGLTMLNTILSGAVLFYVVGVEHRLTMVETTIALTKPVATCTAPRSPLQEIATPNAPIAPTVHP